MKKKSNRCRWATIAAYIGAVLSIGAIAVTILSPDKTAIATILVGMAMLLWIGYDIGRLKRQRKTFQRGYRYGVDETERAYQRNRELNLMTFKRGR